MISTNLDSYQVTLTPLGGTATVQLASGQTAVADGTVLATIDTNRLANGPYTLQLTASDIAGRTTTLMRSIEIDSVAKAEAFATSATDLTVTLDGVMIPITRYYSTVNASVQGSFGYGWTVAAADAHDHDQRGCTDRQRGPDGMFSPFQPGTRLYLNLPTGAHVGFTFTPVAHSIPGLVYYTPAWTPDMGVTYQLASPAATLEVADGGYYQMGTGLPYNPSSNLFTGFNYTKDGAPTARSTTIRPRAACNRWWGPAASGSSGARAA